jgi:hypothetical protein
MNEFEKALFDYKNALEGLKMAVEKLVKSNKQKIDAVRNIAPFLEEIIKKAGK